MAEKKHTDYTELSALSIRVGIITGILTYLFFCILDYFALPENYLTAWTIRPIALLIALAIGTPFVYKKPFVENKEPFLTTLMLGGLFGILAIIAIADPAEVAFKVYYAGLIVINLWAGFVFLLSVRSMYIICGASFFGYNFVAIFIQKIYKPDMDFSIFVANEFFLFAASVLGIVGAYQMRAYKSKIREQYTNLERESQLHLIAKKKAEEADRLKTAFLANMSHEIRTPLNAVVGFSQMLGDDELLNEERAAYTSIIDNNADQLLNIINDIVDIAKIEGDQMTMKFEPVNVNQVIQDCSVNISQIQNQQNKAHIAMESVLAEGENIFVYADYFRVSQVFNNLLGNALKFTQDGSVRFGVWKVHEDTIEFFVKDTGIGIESSKIGNVFQEFTQADESIAITYGGTGLGLTITKRLLTLMGGDVFVSSEKGDGTLIRFTLPRSI